MSQGLSLRELADRSGLSKDAIQRIEKGQSTPYTSLAKLCVSLGTHIARITMPEPDEHEIVSIHLREEETWICHSELASDHKDTSEIGELENESVRRMLVNTGQEIVFNSLLNCQLTGGRIWASLLELHGESTVRSHNGEEFVFCLRGTTMLKVAGREYRLRPGDAATFWSSEPHNYAPAVNEAGESEPALILSVRVNSKAHGR
jgi:transcriptional regulator with XRE-family HTH domain